MSEILKYMHCNFRRMIQMKTKPGLNWGGGRPGGG